MTQNPIAEWKFDEGSGISATDSSGNGYNGKIVGGATWVPGRNGTGTAIHFNGTDSYIDFGMPQFPTGALPRTVSLWANPDNATNDCYILFYGSRSDKNAFYIGQYGSQLFSGSWDLAGASNIYNGFWTTGVWKHTAFTYDGTTAILYANGYEVSRYTSTLNTILNTTKIDMNWNNQSIWAGSVDDVKVWDRTLTPTEVLADFQGTTCPALSCTLNVV